VRDRNKLNVMIEKSLMKEKVDNYDMAKKILIEEKSKLIHEKARAIQKKRQ
jgi:adenylate kinase